MTRRGRRHRTLIACCAVAAVLAPRGADARLHPGLEAGWNLAGVRFEQSVPGSSSSGLGSGVLGLTLEVPVYDPISIATGLRLVTKGARVTRPDTTMVGSPATPEVVSVQGDLRQSYLELPVLMRHRFMHTGRLSFDVGATFGFLLEASSGVYPAAPGGHPPGPGTVDIRSSLAPVDYSIEAAAGYDFPIGAHAMSARLRYDRGLNRCSTAAGLPTNWRTQGVQLLLGLSW